MAKVEFSAEVIILSRPIKFKFTVKTLCTLFVLKRHQRCRQQTVADNLLQLPFVLNGLVINRYRRITGPKADLVIQFLDIIRLFQALAYRKNRSLCNSQAAQRHSGPCRHLGNNFFGFYFAVNIFNDKIYRLIFAG